MSATSASTLVLDASAAVGLILRTAVGELVDAAWERRAKLSIPDALYVVLAAQLGCRLLTADARLTRAPGLGVAVTLVG